MHVNLDCNSSKPQFGMAIHSNEYVNEIIKSRIKNHSELRKLNEIIEKARKNNTVDVNLMGNSDGKTICANIYSTKNITDFFKNKSENLFSRSIGGGIVGFIEKCSKIADKGVAKIRKAEEIANSEAFNKMK